MTAADCIKLADFGLSRWLEENDYYVGELCLEWTAMIGCNLLYSFKG